MLDKKHDDRTSFRGVLTEWCHAFFLKRIRSRFLNSMFSTENPAIPTVVLERKRSKSQKFLESFAVRVIVSLDLTQIFYNVSQVIIF